MMLRQVFALCALMCLLSLSGTAQAAAPATEASKSLETAITRILTIVMDPSYPTPEHRPELNKKIEGEVRTIFDFHEFSQRTAGPAWRNFSPDQQERFSSAFAELLIYTYLGKVDKYNGEKIDYAGVKTDPQATRVEVQTIMTLKDGKAIPVAYRMLPKNGQWRVYDVLIEGISLVKNYRTQFHDILSKNSPDQLIERVQSKAQEMREKSNAKQ